MIDAALDSILKQMSAAGGPKLWETGAVQARMMFAAMRPMFATQSTPIGKVDAIAIPSPDGPIPARVYTPVGLTGRATPGCLYFHGGGWVVGDLDTHDAVCRALANESGVRIVSVDYRLAPEHVFPAAYDDAWNALVWLSREAGGLQILPDRLGVAGDSAGGNLAAAVALASRAKGAPKLRFQLLIYPVTQARANMPSMQELATGYFLEKASMNWFFDQYIPAGVDLNDPRLSPLAVADLSGAPSAHVIVAGYDPLRDEGLAYARKLEAAGVPVTLVDYPTMVHGFAAMGAIVPHAAQALRESGRALAAAMI
jgi:acetyl esterase